MIRALVLVLVLFPALSVRADEPSVATTLAEGDRHYADLDYRAAAESCERAARDPRATPKEQARGWERVGISWLILGQRSLARDAFDRLFTLEPERVITDPSLAPHQREFIEEARSANAAPAKVEPEAAPPVAAPVTPPPPRRPVWKRWYLWVPIAVVVVAGAGVGLGLGLSQHGQQGTLPPGSVSLGLRF